MCIRDSFHDDCSATYTSIGSTPHRTLVGDIVVNQHEAKSAQESGDTTHKDQNAMHRVPTVEELVLSSKIEYKQEVTDMNCTVETSIMALYLSLIHISEPTRLLSISYAVFCLKKKKR
eukprot:TRINITY_DN27773_c0_g1_i2.p1 TRINITY_DN27773_c0_g1~~TRINITY_DN27773_c0_g1_i2.p1  ORF type:complete len:118 (-),score=48.14 TRINITY_DN27773_c0_g1_i2:130-483(-)